MRSLKDKFNDLVLRLGQGRRMESTGADPIYYLVFSVAEIIEVKRETKAWTARLENASWQVVTFSMAEAVNGILREHKLRKTWLMGEKMLLAQAARTEGPLDCAEINKTIAKALTEGPELLGLLRQKIAEASALEGGLLLITDLEAIHPYLRINSLEAQLHGTVSCPVVVLYPGRREGRTSLRFLEFYPADPNYRSEHIG
jgi:hypothetical protein